MDLKNITVTISPKTVIIAILLLLLVWLLYFLQELVLILLTAIVIAAALEPPVRWLTAHKIPRVASVLLMYALIIGFLFIVFYFFVPPVLSELIGFLSSLPEYVESVSSSPGIGNGTFLISQTQAFSLSQLVSDLQATLSSFSGNVLSTISTVFGGIFSFVFITVFAFYFGMQKTGVENFIRVVTPRRHEGYVLDLWKRSQEKIGRWMQGQLILALIVGVLVYLGLTVLGVKYALLLAIIAAMFELIPVFGPILAAVPAVAISFVDGGVTIGFLVIGLYVIIQQFENHLIYPLVVKKVVGVPPLLVILALLVGAKLAGFLGIILSVPVAAVVQELVSDIRKEKEELAKKEQQGIE
jgi:predicted PurR-regulated permease PerM|tara:strand:- start:32483 stop:33547 length:1065 start_codon:yes stop_codon:yes gene_type:complete